MSKAIKISLAIAILFLAFLAGYWCKSQTIVTEYVLLPGRVYDLKSFESLP